jgi:hypothetical protein
VLEIARSRGLAPIAATRAQEIAKSLENRDRVFTV